MHKLIFILTASVSVAAVLMAQHPDGGISTNIFEHADTALPNRWDSAAEETNAPPLLRRPDQDVDTERELIIQTETGSRIELQDETETPPEFAAPEGVQHDSRTDRLLNAAQKYMEEGEYLSAEKAYLRARENYPEDAEIRFRLSTLYITMKRYSEAINYLKQLIEEYPDNPLLYNNLAWVYATGGRVRDGALALRYAREALMLSPYMPSIWNTLAEAYYVSGEYEKAAQISTEALILLSKTNPRETEVQSFQEQQAKIQRAHRTYRVLQGLDEYDN
ncbi:MAG: tetratricopeptide repeat protein [Kiritimatiellales bacterium]